jgi:SAM-dependent methyltransferase
VSWTTTSAAGIPRLQPAEGQPRCRSCGSTALVVFLHLGELPLPDALLRDDELEAREPRYPLDLAVCPECSLVQILAEVPPERLFVDNYLYFSSYSDDLLQHSREHALALVSARELGPRSLVVEIASNDGYLLRNFVEAGVPVLGIDPAPAQAEAAEAAGVPTVPEFFGSELAQQLRSEGRRADVIVANNVLAHTPDPNDLVAGMTILLADDGVITIENTYVRDLIANLAFDTIYHEHFSYFSCTAIDALARRHGLFLNAVEHFPEIQGGSLRWHLGKRDAPDSSVERYLRAERELGLVGPEYYRRFGERVDAVSQDLLELLRGLKAEGASIAAYGAAAKGTVLLNHVGIDGSLVGFVVDRNPHKQGLFMPGVHLPIRGPEALLEEPPDYLLLLAWNYRDEIMRQQEAYRRLGGRFIVPLPEPEIV